MRNNILVSVIVLTYNSEKYIIDTLESIKKQTYKNLEVIVSDDASKDNTIKICEKWRKINSEIFTNFKILKSDQNEGIIKNLNKACKKAEGEWIKTVAGDDLLLENCIFDNINYIENNEFVNFLFSKTKTFGELEIELPNLKKYFYYNLAPKEQFKNLLLGNFVIAPTSFIKTKKLKEVNYFDEEFNMVEDLSMWLKVTEKNEKLYFMDKVTVNYRIHKNSVSHKKNLKYLSDLIKIENKYNKNNSYLIKYHFWILTKIYGSNKNLFKTLLKLTSPLYIKMKFLELIRIEK